MSISRDNLKKPAKKKQDNLRIICYGCLAIFIVCAAIIGISTKIGGKIWKYEEPKVTVKAMQQPGSDPKYEYDIPAESLGIVIDKTEQEAYDEIEGLLKLEIKYGAVSIYFGLVTEAVSKEEMRLMVSKVLDMYIYNLRKINNDIDPPNRNYFSHYYVNYEVVIYCTHPGDENPYWIFRKPFGKSFLVRSLDEK